MTLDSLTEMVKEGYRKRFLLKELQQLAAVSPSMFSLEWNQLRKNAEQVLLVNATHKFSSAQLKNRQDRFQIDLETLVQKYHEENHPA